MHSVKIEINKYTNVIALHQLSTKRNPRLAYYKQ